MPIASSSCCRLTRPSSTQINLLAFPRLDESPLLSPYSASLAQLSQLRLTLLKIHFFFASGVKWNTMSVCLCVRDELLTTCDRPLDQKPQKEASDEKKNQMRVRTHTHGKINEKPKKENCAEQWFWCPLLASHQQKVFAQPYFTHMDFGRLDSCWVLDSLNENGFPWQSFARHSAFSGQLSPAVMALRH